MPLSWSIRRLLKRDSSSKHVNGKSDETSISDKVRAQSGNSNTEQKRKAPSAPQQLKQNKSLHSDFNETKSNVTSQAHPISATTPSRESWTSSCGTDYSASSSTTISSTSGSAVIEEVSGKSEDEITSENISALIQKTQNGYCGQLSDDDLNTTYLVEGKFNKSDNVSEKLCSSQPEINDCASISDYVENAILNSSSANLFSSSPNKSGENFTEVGVSHLPPRLTSFESSSTLHQEGLLLKSTSEIIQPYEGSLKPHYVSLDFVQSAVAEGRFRRKSRDGDSNRSNNSLTSSVVSSVDSDGGSTIGSEVVDRLYEKITASSARHNLTTLTTSQSPDTSTGDIEKDLFPLLFPGRRRGENKDEKLSSSLNHVDYIRPPNNESTPTAKVDDFLQRNFNNNNSLAAEGKLSCRDTLQRSIEGKFPLSAGLQVAELIGHKDQRGIKKCEQCFGVIVDEKNTSIEDMNKARDFFGQCLCTAGDVSDLVTEIDFSNSNLKEVPEEISDHAQTLVKLTIESNNITELPKELFVCQNLRSLSVSDNDITALPPSLASLISLTHLDVSKNVIEDLPECIRCCKNLQVLDASVNPIEKLSEGFTQLISLRELYMNDCFFDFLPANFGRMIQLCVLELRDNQLQILPKSIRRLTQLTRLDLGGNVFQDWPDVISKLINLSELWLDCNELSKVPADIGDLTKLTYLDISRNFLEYIPGQIGSLEHLTDLLLSENNLTNLPDSIGFLRQLTMLNLESNQISNIPESFGKLRALEELNASHNKLKMLPSSIANLKSLTTLLLDDNKLQEIPKEIGMCTNLNILQLSRNQIGFLPESVGDLKNLRVLNICQNRIPYLPITMIKLPGLEALWISPNQSKCNVPLHAELHPQNRCRILTNILFPQEEKGVSRARKVLGTVDANDEEAYANDAADDADLDAYAKRERGRTHVIFDLDAITYSDDVTYDMDEYDDDDNEEMDLTPNQSASSMKPEFTDNQTVASPVVPAEKDASTDHRSRVQPAIKSYSAESSLRPDVKGSSDLSEVKFKCPSQSAGDEKPVMKTANVKLVKGLKYDNVEIFSKENTTKQKSPLTKDSNTKIQVSEECRRNSENDEINSSTPAGSAGIKTWSSHSNLPSALIEQTEEWNPDETEPNSSTDVQNDQQKSKSFSYSWLPTKTDAYSHSASNPSYSKNVAVKTSSSQESKNTKTSPVTESSKLSAKQAAEKKSTHFSNASDLLDRLEKLTNRSKNKAEKDITSNPTEVVNAPTKKSLKQRSDKDFVGVTKEDAKQEKCSPKNVFINNPDDENNIVFKNIPFMDLDEEMLCHEDKTDFSKYLPHHKSMNDTEIKPETSFKDSKPSSDVVQQTDNRIKNKLKKEVEKNGEHVVNERCSSSPVCEAEAASSSVASGESMPVTDLDSGVGNDVESQESIPDVQEDQNDIEVVLPATTSQTICASKHDSQTVRINDTSSLRRGKGGWLALVRTDNTTEEQNKVKVAKEHTTSSNTATAVARPSPTSKSRYVPAVTVDSTRVTYSHEYNSSRLRNDRSLRSVGSNKVANNIKKFEKFFENGVAAPQNSDDKIKVSSSRQAKVEPIKNKSTLPHSTAVAPIVAVYQTNQREQRISQVKEVAPSNFPPTKATVPRPENSSKSTEPLTQVKVGVSKPLRNRVTFSESSEPSPTERKETDTIQTKRISANMRKSKFEEALAATKHKHFRDKIAKTMQQDSSLSPNRRLSRNSSSSISSIPRITSPIPHHHRTHLDRMTAESTKEYQGNRKGPQPVKTSSIHKRLKEKLQPNGTSSERTVSNPPRRHPEFMREQQDSTRRLERGSSTQRSSLRKQTTSQSRRSVTAEDSSKKSLEEQLGQLLLDGAVDIPQQEEKGFVPYVENDRHPTQLHGNSHFTSLAGRDPIHSSSSSSHSYNSRRNPLPVDWKLQLLEHIERKKQEKEMTLSKTNAMTAYHDPRYSLKTHHDAFFAPPVPLTSSKSNEASNRLQSNHYTAIELTSSIKDRGIPRSVTAPEITSKSQDRRDLGLHTEEQRDGNFPRSSSKQPGGRRSSGRFQRTRTPGPEMAASELNRTDLVARPKSAMDKPTSTSAIFAQRPSRDVGTTSREQPEKALPFATPPSYEDHVLRRATAVADKQDHHDYVNMDYIEQIRSSMRKKSGERFYPKTSYNEAHEVARSHPLRSTGSHESVLNSKNEKPVPYDAPARMRASNSHDSILDNPYPTLQNTNQNLYQRSTHESYPDVTSYTNKPKTYSSQQNWYGEIPAPAKTNRSAPKVPNYEPRAHIMTSQENSFEDYYNPETKRHHDFPSKQSYGGLHSRFSSDKGERGPHLPRSLHRNAAEREDESVASAFRPYREHQRVVVPQRNPLNPHRSQNRSNDHPRYEDESLYVQQHPNYIDHHRHYHHLGKEQRHRLEQRYPHLSDTYLHRDDHYHHEYEGNYSVQSDISSSLEPSRHWREADAGVELITVTVRKNPTFGFHIMGGIDAGGNPYRHDDDGVFLTYVAPGGSADGLLQPGDKILLVNGSDFVGITHKRAVDLLRNAGQVAVLVVERTPGKAV